MEKSSGSFESDRQDDIEELMPLNGSLITPLRRASGSNHARGRIIAFTSGILVTSIVFLIIWSYGVSSSIRHLPNMFDGTDQRTGKPNSWFNGDCGSSAEEARYRGCRFDRVLHSWLPKACTTAEDLAEEREFLETDWKYYNDSARTLISSQSVYSGEVEVVYTDWRWHLVHCTYVWKKLHRALLDGRNIDSYMASLEHTNHCAKMLLMDVGEEDYLTRIFTKFPTCG